MLDILHRLFILFSYFYPEKFYLLWHANLVINHMQLFSWGFLLNIQIMFLSAVLLGTRFFTTHRKPNQTHVPQGFSWDCLLKFKHIYTSLNAVFGLALNRQNPGVFCPGIFIMKKGLDLLSWADLRFIFSINHGSSNCFLYGCQLLGT